MKIFAIELSSRFGSLALVEDGRVVSEKSWEENFKNRQQLFDAMAEMEIEWDGVDLFAAGRGPGAFSGMRIAFSVVNSLAAPGGQPVYALNSGAALAAQIGAERTVVVGDARRNKVWAGVFVGSELEKEFQLLERDELAGFVPSDALVVSPDHDRLEELLAGFQTLESAAPVFPSAGTLGQLVFQRLENGIESEPFEPLYMHPPVFVAPRFPA
ncbi:MAG: tRNA (adenosine(37)-N6)-threonylcarbamoyltransferase complex dimerization subunit type 1 TsaB [Verrucomicrobiota bacterium]